MKRASFGQLSRWVLVLLFLLQACLPATQVAHPPGEATTSAYPTLTVLPSAIIGSIPSQITAPKITETSTPESTATQAPPVIFAAIGDYGSGDQAEGEVAKLVLSWKPDFIITLGDNNYPSGEANHIDAAIGQFFHNFIYPYLGSYGTGAEVNRFFPSLGNHDLLSDRGQPYFDYFSLPGNERYYDFVWGPVHLFALDDLDSEPDGVGVSSKQASWLKQALEASTSAWNIVYMHYPPYSSGRHGSTDWARWPYGEWGAEAVLAGHDHTYERLLENGVAYFVNGLGGYSRYDFVNILDGSQMRYNADYGAMRIEATYQSILFEFISRDNELIDRLEINK